MNASRAAAVLLTALGLLGLCNVRAQHSVAAGLPAATNFPDMVGFWETDVAADLISGALSEDQPQPTGDPSSAPGNGLSPRESAFLSRTVVLGKPPYTAEWEAKAKNVATGAAFHPGPPTGKACLSAGFPFVMDSPTPDGMFQVVLTVQETLFLFPDGEARQIYTDGRSHPKSKDLWPTQMGDSIGHWEGRTLVVDTIARKAGPISPIPLPGTAQLSDDARFEERIRLLTADTMEDDLTINDAGRFAHPWHLTILYRRITDLDRMIPINCSENDRNPVIDGKVVIAAP
jgi:hypothetical protein